MLKNSVLVYRIRALVGFLNAYYEKSISQKIFSKLGQGLSLVLGGSFLARLGKKSMDGAYVNQVLSGLYRGLDRGGERLTNWKESARGPSLLGAYASQFQDPLEGLCGLGWTLFFWSLVLGIFRPRKLLLVLALLGLGLALTQTWIRLARESVLARGLLWTKDLIYEEDDHEK